ncbi:MAG: hypothetical protein KGV50_06705 [Gammaproteobacteria bacterium]|nr:hypothetical protein [Gammaproteobacteria bacterium]
MKLPPVKPISKRQQVINALLTGEHLTVREISDRFLINDPKTTIWELRTKKDMPIITIEKQGKNGKYGEYFMTAQAIKEYCQNKGINHE